MENFNDSTTSPGFEQQLAAMDAVANATDELCAELYPRMTVSETNETVLRLLKDPENIRIFFKGIGAAMRRTGFCMEGCTRAKTRALMDAVLVEYRGFGRFTEEELSELEHSMHRDLEKIPE